MTNHDLQADESGRGPRGDQPKRRTYTAAYKAQILNEYDAAPAGTKGAILRREGLYDSTIQRWRKQRDKGASTALSGERTVSSAQASKEHAKDKAAIAKLERENARLAKKLAHTEAAVEILGKWVALLDSMSESADSENS
jgi:transposase